LVSTEELLSDLLVSAALCGSPRHSAPLVCFSPPGGETRDVAEGRQLGDVTALANAEIVDQIRDSASAGGEEE